MNSLTFTRVEADGVYYTDLQKSLRFAVKFDVFNDKDQIAVLLTNNSSAYTLSSLDNTKLFLTSKLSWFSSKSWYYIKDELGKQVATMHSYTKGLFFRKKIYSITLGNNEETCFMVERNRKQIREIDANFAYDFFIDEQVCCSIINLKKPRFIYQPPTTKLEGIIEYSPTIDLTRILCLLQFINIKIALEFDI